MSIKPIEKMEDLIVGHRYKIVSKTYSGLDYWGGTAVCHGLPEERLPSDPDLTGDRGVFLCEDGIPGTFCLEDIVGEIIDEESDEMPPAPVIPEGSGESVLTAREQAALSWVLWHHQGGSSTVGQPIRKMLGLGEHDRLSAELVATARLFDETERLAAIRLKEPGQTAFDMLPDDYEMG